LNYDFNAAPVVDVDEDYKNAVESVLYNSGSYKYIDDPNNVDSLEVNDNFNHHYVKGKL